VQRSLGRQLRAIVLATPFALEGCSLEVPGAPSCSAPQQETLVFSLSYDGGKIDAGDDCFVACDGFSVDLSNVSACAFVTLDGGGPGLSCRGEYTPTYYGLGRRPASLVESDHTVRPGVLGAHFAHAARLEAASARAFRVLARELLSHGAPAALVRVARRSASEEVRHASATGRLARRFGAAPVRARYGASHAVRSLEDVALENATESCVRETSGAAVAWWQAERSRDPRVARAMRRIARDETRHAQLSWDIAAWAEPRLSRAARARITRARSQAVGALRAEVDHDVAPELVTTAGVPPRASARDLLSRLEGSIGLGATARGRGRRAAPTTRRSAV
jgi:rubrerythrin